MSSQKAPVQQANVLPAVTDPLKVEDVYATEVMVTVRDEVVHEKLKIN